MTEEMIFEIKRWRLSAAGQDVIVLSPPTTYAVEGQW